MYWSTLIICILCTVHSITCKQNVHQQVDEVDDEFIQSLVERLTNSVDSLARQINSGKALSQASHGSTVNSSTLTVARSPTTTPITLPLLPDNGKNDTVTQSHTSEQNTTDGVPRILQSFLNLLRSLSTRMGGEEMNELLIELTKLIQNSIRMITSSPSSYSMQPVHDDEWNSIIETIRQVLLRHRVNAIITHRQIRNNHTHDDPETLVLSNCSCACDRDSDVIASYMQHQDIMSNVTDSASLDTTSASTWSPLMSNLTVPVAAVDPLSPVLTVLQEYIRSVEAANRRVNNVTAILSKMFSSVARIATGQLRTNDSTWVYGQPLVKGIESYVEVLRHFETNVAHLGEQFKSLRENLLPFVPSHNDVSSVPNSSQNVKYLPVDTLNYRSTVDDTSTIESEQLSTMVKLTSQVLKEMQTLVNNRNRGNERNINRIDTGASPIKVNEGDSVSKKDQVSRRDLINEIVKKQKQQLKKLRELTTSPSVSVSTVDPVKKIGEFVTQVISVNGKLTEPFANVVKGNHKHQRGLPTTTVSPDEYIEEVIYEGTELPPSPSTGDRETIGDRDDGDDDDNNSDQSEVTGSDSETVAIPSPTTTRQPEQFERIMRQIQSGINRLLLAVKSLTSPYAEKTTKGQ